MSMFIFSILLQVLFCIIVTLLIFLIGLRLYFQPVKEVCRCKTKLNGKVALVTGGNSGIGLETARELARRGAKVIIASRDVARSAAAVSDIISTTGNPQVEHKHLDLSKFKSVRQLAEDFNKSGDPLHILVNNAGVSSLKNRLTEDGIDMIMQINHFGHALLTNLLLDKLKESAPSRIVVVSSILHHVAILNLDDLAAKNKSHFMVRYNNSKLCNILWARALAKVLPKGVTVNCLHPGLVSTNIFQKVPPLLGFVVGKILDIFFKVPKEGAQTVIHLCVSPDLEEQSGGYYTECQVKKPSKVAQDDDLADAVWQKTTELIN
ncbi:retinol dehydrogenase 12-like [Zerene cesonia]|uniref:retinol dehydrogenase 12-like n=1 Tax=Zerene cesonia TaxID=33412 RepID=UPI0018E4F382|nr:retinol dehydrogenase 12-like [Zerene cesonia]